MYLVIDNMGTRVKCWTLNGALAWLSYCGKHAYIVGKVTGKIYAQRHTD